MENIRIQRNACENCIHASYCMLPGNSLPQLPALQFQAKMLIPGEHLCYQGQSSENLYILRAGLLKSYFLKPNGDEYIMGFYLPPDLFGFEGIDPLLANITLTITAMTPANICIIPIEKLSEMTQQSPILQTQLMRMVSRRIHQDNVALLRTTAKQRVATFLLQLAARYEQLQLSSLSIHLHMTHQDIANYLRITSHTISRIFHEWHNKKIIALEKHAIRLLNVDEIRLIAEY